MSIFRKSDYARKKEVVHKTKLPTQAKSEPLTQCPFCSKKFWSQKLKKCKFCKVEHRPDKQYTITKANKLYK